MPSIRPCWESSEQRSCAVCHLPSAAPGAAVCESARRQVNQAKYRLHGGSSYFGIQRDVIQVCGFCMDGANSFFVRFRALGMCSHGASPTAEYSCPAAHLAGAQAAGHKVALVEAAHRADAALSEVRLSRAAHAVSVPGSGESRNHREKVAPNQGIRLAAAAVICRLRCNLGTFSP